MAFADALQETATFYSEAKTRSAIGGAIKTPTAQYSSIPCRLHKANTFPRNQGGAQKGSSESFEDTWIMIVEAAYNGGARGWTVTSGGQNYIITGKKEIRGTSSVINHVVYYLQEYNG